MVTQVTRVERSEVYRFATSTTQLTRRSGARCIDCATLPLICNFAGRK